MCELLREDLVKMHVLMGRLRQDQKCTLLLINSKGLILSTLGIASLILIDGGLEMV